MWNTRLGQQGFEAARQVGGNDISRPSTTPMKPVHSSRPAWVWMRGVSITLGRASTTGGLVDAPECHWVSRRAQMSLVRKPLDCIRLIARLAALAAVCAGCSSTNKETQERASWQATVRMTASAWLNGAVSNRFAIDTLQTAGRQTKSSQYESLAEAIANQDYARVRQSLGHE
jgi:hypothetical protein